MHCKLFLKSTWFSYVLYYIHYTSNFQNALQAGGVLHPVQASVIIVTMVAYVMIGLAIVYVDLDSWALTVLQVNSYLKRVHNYSDSF